MRVAGWESLGWSLAVHDLARGTARAQGTTRNCRDILTTVKPAQSRDLHLPCRRVALCFTGWRSREACAVTSIYAMESSQQENQRHIVSKCKHSVRYAGKLDVTLLRIGGLEARALTINVFNDDLAVAARGLLHTLIHLEEASKYNKIVEEGQSQSNAPTAP